jgi:RNA polymerase sigma-70 factor, ECF subfamily
LESTQQSFFDEKDRLGTHIDQTDTTVEEKRSPRPNLKTPGLNRVASPARTSDAELVARCCAGDRGAWRLLYERHAALVYRFLSALGIRDPEREDACQDVFMAVYRSLPSFRGESQLSTWIYRITARTTGKMIQKRRLRTALAAMMLSEPAPPPPDPSEKTTRNLMLDRMLDRLHPKKRLVLVLFELEGVPVEEIARIADCPTNTVWSRLHHARLDLTKMAEREGKRRVGSGRAKSHDVEKRNVGASESSEHGVSP